MTNKEAAEYLVSDFDDVRDLLTGIAETHPKKKVTGMRRAVAAHVIALSEDGNNKAIIVLNHGKVTAFHASEYDEELQMWSKTTLNLGARNRQSGAPVQIMYHDSVHQPRIGIPVETLEEIPQEICDKLYGAVALFGTVETEKI